MKVILNAFLLAQAAKANNTSLMAASIALNGGVRTALLSVAVLFLFRLIKPLALVAIPTAMYWLAHVG